MPAAQTIDALRAALHRAPGFIAGLLDRMEPHQADELARIGRIRHVERGAQLFPEGERARDVGFVLDGALGMTKVLPDGRVHIVGLLVPGDMFGRLFDGPLTYQIEALSPVRVLTFDRERFETLLRDAPEAERMLLVMVLDELDAAREWLILLNGTSVVERLASFLLVLVRRQLVHRDAAGGTPLRVRVPIRRVDLAHYLGVRPESISRAIHRLERDGVLRIEDPNTFLVADLGRLVDASGQDLVLAEDAHHGASSSER